MKIEIPGYIAQAMRQLEQNGYEAYIVGGAVRDALLGRVPADWDLATDAKAEEIGRCFKKHFNTGIRHGTVTALVDGRAVEITTYRIDGAYTDHRRPDTVRFTSSLQEDLKRRDFTINAMAYGTGLIDPYGGAADLKDKIIRCVGDPYRRFDEDALRILRGLRFAARLEFAVEPQTLAAMRDMRQLLQHISAERIREELFKLLCTGSGFLLLEQSGAAEVVLPEFWGCNAADVQQRLSAVPPRPNVRLAALLGILGNREQARQVLSRLKTDNATKKTVLLLVEYAAAEITDAADLRRVLGHAGPKTVEKLLQLRPDRARLLPLYEGIMHRQEAYTIRQLHIDGNDLLQAGFSGREIGTALHTLLQRVLEQPELNRRDTLLRLAGEMKK